MVRLCTLDTKNWKNLLQFRERLLQQGWPVPGSEEQDLQATAAMQEAGTGDSDTTPPPEQSTVVRRIIHIKNRPISREKRAAIQREANGILGARAVAERHGVHESTVRAIWRQRPRPKQRGPHRFTEEDCQRAKALLTQGRTLIEIGLELGFDRSTVRKHLGV
ncbi:DNA-binding protein [Actinomyces bowdenii]|uniref:DNA-binding protein n=1 Tax=Actinomyces bowdenii TaxID=131109 RepID=UPI001C54C876|nr:DNA-binding protein [Actinomyces bowdenii]